MNILEVEYFVTKVTKPRKVTCAFTSPSLMTSIILEARSDAFLPSGKICLP